MEFQLDKNQRKIVHGAARENFRPELHSVHVRNNVIEVANGFIAVQMPCNYVGDEETLINIDHIKEHKPIGRGGRVPIYYQVDDGKVRAIGNITYESEVVGGLKPYPDIDKIIAPEGEPVHHIALGAKELRNVLECLGPRDIIKFYFYQDQDANHPKPVRFEVSGNEGVKGCIMPCFVNWEDEPGSKT